VVVPKSSVPRMAQAVGSDMWHQTRPYLIRLFSFGLQALLLKSDLPADASANCQGSHMSINSHPDRSV
jgi:hypothetical protein